MSDSSSGAESHRSRPAGGRSHSHESSADFYQTPEDAPRPYVVTEDVQPLVETWAKERDFTPPSQEFWDKFNGRFRGMMGAIFPNFVLLPAQEITEEVRRRVSKYEGVSGVAIIALDELYNVGEHQFNMTRYVDPEGTEIGIGTRFNTPGLATQLKTIVDDLRSRGITEVVLVDDVIFNGTQVMRLARLLARAGIKVKAVVAAVGIGSGVERLQTEGIDVECARVYPHVIDQVCQRDFFPGVPAGGRTIPTDSDEGIPYLLPLGKPLEWASIPEEWELSLSQFCLQETIALFEEIERRSHKPVLCRDLPRTVANLPRDERRFVDVLQEMLDHVNELLKRAAESSGPPEELGRGERE
ncbi:MAG: phosphoribosyltransferase [Patescibacteria group bacterium]